MASRVVQRLAEQPNRRRDLLRCYGKLLTRLLAEPAGSQAQLRSPQHHAVALEAMESQLLTIVSHVGHLLASWTAAAPYEAVTIESLDEELSGSQVIRLEAELVELLRAGVVRCVKGEGLGGDYEVDDAAFRDYITRLPIGHGAHSLLLRGFYAAQLRPWREAFGAERILVLRCEDMVTSEGAAAAVALAQRHAGLREHPLDDARPRNARSYAGPPDDLVEDLRRFFARANEDLYEMLGWGDGERW